MIVIFLPSYVHLYESAGKPDMCR